MVKRKTAVQPLFLVAMLALFVGVARAKAPLQAFTDNTSYNAGSMVQLKIVFNPTGEPLPPSIDIKANIRYAGEPQNLLEQYPIVTGFTNPREKHVIDYLHLWQIPSSARTGRYEIDLLGLDAISHQNIFTLPDAATFVVYKKLVRIEQIKLDKTFYISGDRVSADVTLANLAHVPLKGLRVEFSNRYWPWIAGPADAAKASVVTLTTNLTLPPGGRKDLHAERVEVADYVKLPSTHQYGVVVWDEARKTVLDIAFSPLAFVYPPGITEPRPFPNLYVYSTLDAVNTSGYRQFDSAGIGSAAIKFDRTHTMLAAGSKVAVEFSVTNPTRVAWKGVSIRYRILGPGGGQLTHETVAGPVDLFSDSKSPPLRARASISADSSGLYRVEAEVVNAGGDILAGETLELAVNPLPKSILIFCAHEDDEGGYSGLTRAAIENHVPIHYVYFTSGDAGSCDIYYQHSCGPGDALNFGGLRMDEVRASLGHLGVSRDDILFVGLPDGGSGQIWYEYLSPGTPFLDPLLAIDHAPYEGLVKPNLPYARDSVVETVETLIRKFQPDVIATPHPKEETHIDHIVNNYFVVKALQALVHEGAVSPKLRLLVDRPHDPKLQLQTPYHYKDVTFYVSGDVATLAQESQWFYLSQGGSRAQGNIKPFDKLPRTEEFRQLLDWNEHQGWNEKRVHTAQ